MQTFKIEKTDAQCVVSWRHFSWVVLFLFVKLGAFTILCVVLTLLVFVQQMFSYILLALMFWGYWLFIFSAIINVLFGKTRFVLDKNGLVSTYTCLMFKREKWIDLTDICCFEKRRIDTRRVETGLYYLLRVAYQYGEVDFSIPSKDLEKELDDCCNQLNVFLETLKAEAAH